VRRGERGTTLVVAMIVVVVLMLIGMAAVARGGVEVEAAGMRRRHSGNVSCVEAARELVMSQLSLTGARITGLAITRQVGDLTLQTGHYDRQGAYITVDSTYGNCSTGTGGTINPPWMVIGDVTNRSTLPLGGLASGGGSGTTTSPGSCGIRIPVLCTDASGRQLELEFVVKLGL